VKLITAFAQQIDWSNFVWSKEEKSIKRQSTIAFASTSARVRLMNVWRVGSPTWSECWFHMESVSGRILFMAESYSITVSLMIKCSWSQTDTRPIILLMLWMII